MREQHKYILISHMYTLYITTMIHTKASFRLIVLLSMVFVAFISMNICCVAAFTVRLQQQHPPHILYPPATTTTAAVGPRSWSPYHHHRRRLHNNNNNAQQPPHYLARDERCSETNNIVASSSSSSPVPKTSNSNSNTTTTTESLLDSLLSWFQGDFDNYRQVVLDRQAGLLPREWGGHEHIHCSLIPVTYTTRLAAFYFDGAPQAIFRFRFYRLLETTTDGSTVDTILYTLSNELESKLRACSDVLQWPNIWTSHVMDPRFDVNDTTTSSENDDDDDVVERAIRSASIVILPNCEVRWSRERDAIQHSYVDDFIHDDDDNENHQPMMHQNHDTNHHDSISSSSGLHAIMVHGSALVDSQMMPGQKILIMDQLSLWENQLWIHDRGYHPDTGAFIYGNQRGIPYRMQRVTVVVENECCCRRITDVELAWTLGNDYRTLAEYEANMQRIGGSSRKL